MKKIVLEEETDIWMNEYFVTKGKSCIPISSNCNAHCIFCSNNHNPFILYNPGDRSLESIFRNLQAAKFQDGIIRLCENLPGRIKEGESLLHPQIWEILDWVRERYTKELIVFGTNGSMLTEEFVFNLSVYKPIMIDTLSLNSSDAKNWSKLLGKKEADAKVAIESVKYLQKYDIPFVCSLVAMPQVTGYQDIIDTIEYGINNGCKEFIVWKPGYTKYTNINALKLMKYDDKKLQEIVDNLNSKYDTPVTLFPKKLDLVEDEDIRNVYSAFENKNNLFLCSEAALDYVTFNVRLYSSTDVVFMVKNNSYGGNICVAGLLMVNDFIQAYQLFRSQNKQRIDRIFVPSTPFDTYGRDLMYNSIRDLEKISGVPVYQI